jgi:DNA-directed RNA polymerase specialized sigma24 family protein
MATLFASESLNATPSTPLWGIVLLEHLDELATLAWYLVADGKLVEEAFSRTLAKLDTISFDASIPALIYSQARGVLIAQAIAVALDMRMGEAGNWSVEPNSIGRLPDLARLAFMLKLIIRSPEPEIAKYLGVSSLEAKALVFESRHKASTVATKNFTS